MPDGTPAASAISNIVQARTKELGETTEQACTALAINVLKSIRADSKTANTKGNIVVEDVTAQYYPSFSREKGAKGKKISTRVLRAGGKDGPVVQPDKVVWVCGNYVKGEKLFTFKVTDKRSEDKTFSYLMVCKSQKVAERHANKFHRAKVKRSRGLARYALGLAMHRVHAKESVTGNIDPDAKTTAQREVDVNVNNTGFNNGSFSIYVHDKLEYAALAMNGGDNAVQMAMQRALNGMTAYINKRFDAQGSIMGPIKVPFPELGK